MNKIKLIAQREFLTRVKKRTFLLTTIGLPLLIFGLYALMIYFAAGDSSDKKIAVADNAKIFNGNIDNTGSDIKFVLVQSPTEQQLTALVEKGDYDACVFIPQQYNLLGHDSLEIQSAKAFGLSDKSQVKDKFESLIENKKYEAAHISKAQIDSLHTSSIKFNTLQGGADSDAKTTVSSIVGYISGFLIYIILLLYGTAVMRGVMEEKVSRIAEVIISSVKPFQLMMGKILGIGMVGLVQFLIWIVLTVGSRLLLYTLFPDLLHGVQTQASAATADTGGFAEILSGMGQINFPLIIGCFIFYFLGGYLLYAALFASIGCAVNEDPSDAQSLSLPVTMPIIFGIVIMTKAINDPSSGIAVFGSLFPFTSPIVMMARIAYGVPDPVPYWQLIASMLLLILGFLGTTWLAAKIYRTGILMYGKKPTWKEMLKWVGRKG